MHITHIIAGLPEAVAAFGLLIPVVLFFIGLVWLVLPFFLMNRLWKIQCEIAAAGQKARDGIQAAHTDMLKRSVAIEQRLVDIETRMESFRAPLEETGWQSELPEA